MTAEDGFVPTPEPLADYLAGQVLLSPDPDDRILYPGAGTGSIAAAVHRRCSVRGHAAPDAVAVERDRDRAAQLRERFVDEDASVNHGVPEMSEESRSYHRPMPMMGTSGNVPREPVAVDAEFEVQETDFLRNPPAGEFDLIVANPPYLRYMDIDKKDRKTYTELFETAEGQYDLYMPFIEQMLHLLKSDGTLVFLAPGNYLTMKKARPLREMLRHYCLCTPRAIPDFLFPDHKVKTVATTVGGMSKERLGNDSGPTETKCYLTYIHPYETQDFLTRCEIPEDDRQDVSSDYMDFVKEAQRRVGFHDRRERDEMEEAGFGEAATEKQSALDQWTS